MQFALVFSVLLCLAARSVARKPHPCRAPPLLTGSLSLGSTENVWAYGRYIYDALGERIRFFEVGQYKNQSFGFDALLLYREGVKYYINDKNRTCGKVALKQTFQPVEIPKNSTLVNQIVLGSSSGPGQGLLVNVWGGEVPEEQGKYMSTVTEFGCIPISTLYYSPKTGWTIISYFNIVQGVEDPNMLNPPPFCKDAKLINSAAEDFFSTFL
ncbi:ependymin [Chanos chanos]|uniref:Ependymin n=1 Tax=Chanos chanos TaxID=29144 RepID=A0A6J2VS28_CHACN|nr:ependymin-like [Chanos chanos]